MLLADDYPSLKMRYRVMDRSLTDLDTNLPAGAVGGRGVAALDGKRWSFRTDRSNNNNHSWGGGAAPPPSPPAVADRTVLTARHSLTPRSYPYGAAR